MRTATTLFLLVGLLVGFTACEKEVDHIATGNNSINPGGSGSTNNTNNIEGDYDFVGMEAYTQSTVRVITSSQTVETHTESYYITKNNSGTMTITSNQLIGTNIAYSIDTTMNVKTIVDNVLFDDSDFPYVTSSPASSSTSPYVRVSSDSITVTGAIGVATDPSGTLPTGPVGTKLSWSGDTLLLKINTTFSQAVTQGGVPGQITGSVNGVTKLKKH